MVTHVDLGSGLELIVISGGSLKYNRADKPFRDLVRQVYHDVQRPVLEAFGENIEDKALLPKDSIGPTNDRGMLTDRNDPQLGYNYLILTIQNSEGNPKPIGMRVTDEFRIPHDGRVLMEYFSAMVLPEYDKRKFGVNVKLLSEDEFGSASVSPSEILMTYAGQLTKSPSQYVFTFSDGVGIARNTLAGMDYERFGPEGKTLVWVPPLNAETREDYEKAIPMEMFVKPGPQFPGRGIPEEAALFIAVEKYIREGSTELSAKKLRKVGFQFDTLPSVVETINAIRTVARQHEGYVPISPIQS